MGKYIIDTQSGTMVNAEYCYLVDDADISEDLNPMSDRELSELAEKVGVSLRVIGQDTGWGDNKYRYSVSYSPLTIKDEAYSLLDGGIYDDPEDEKYRNALKWVNTTATQSDLERISDFIMAEDSVWNGFRENLMEALMFVYDEIKEEGN